MSSTAGLPESRDLIVERLPASAENMGARDHDIDLMRPRFHRPANFRNALGERRQARGKSGGDCRNVNAASLQGVQRGFDEAVVDAHGAHLDAEVLDPEFLYEILLNGLSRLRAQSPHALVGVIAGERGQVHAGNPTQKPRGLPFFLYRPASHLGLRPAFHGARVDPNVLQPIQIEGNTGVGEKRTSGEGSDRVRGMLLYGRDLASRFAREVGITVIDRHSKSALYRFCENARPRGLNTGG